MADLPTGTVTFLFTDVEGSTALWERQPGAMQVALARHDAILRSAIEAHGGHLFKSMGDGVAAVFAGPPDALAAAVEAQRRVQAESWGEPGPLRVRIALHAGAAELRDGDYLGPPLNRLARLLAVGHGGQTLLSEAAQELVRDWLPAEVTLEDLGEHRLRDLQRPERVFQLQNPDLHATFPPLRSLGARDNLPLQLTSFVGREREIATVRRLLGEVRLVTLTGAGEPARRAWRCRSRPICWTSMSTECGWLSWRRWPTRTWCRGPSRRRWVSWRPRDDR